MKKQISPKEFLEFAKKDFKGGEDIDDRDLVNAYSNLKRAMHSQIDFILEHFNLLERAKNKRLSFPAKFDWIHKLGFIPPKSFIWLNKSRNILEHDYLLPDEKEVLLGLDVVGMYIEYSKHVMSDVMKYSEKWKKHLAKVSGQELTTYELGKIKVVQKGNKSLMDLSDYPKKFISNGLFEGMIVVGDEGLFSDVRAGADIATSLQISLGERAANQGKKMPVVGRALLASEVDSLVDSLDNNIISIGNPDINPITAKIMGTNINADFRLIQGTSVIKIYDLGNNKRGIVVLGSDGESIMRAGRVLANAQDYNLSGKEVEITGRNLNDIIVKENNPQE
jgi:5'(3')-deoxyribonucleotidase